MAIGSWFAITDILPVALNGAVAAVVTVNSAVKVTILVEPVSGSRNGNVVPAGILISLLNAIVVTVTATVIAFFADNAVAKITALTGKIVSPEAKGMTSTLAPVPVSNTVSNSPDILASGFSYCHYLRVNKVEFKLRTKQTLTKH